MRASNAAEVRGGAVLTFTPWTTTKSKLDFRTGRLICKVSHPLAMRCRFCYSGGGLPFEDSVAPSPGDGLSLGGLFGGRSVDSWRVEVSPPTMASSENNGGDSQLFKQSIEMPT